MSMHANKKRWIVGWEQANWTAPSWGGWTGFMVRCAFDLFRVFRGEKHKRIFTTDNTEYTDESQSHKTVDQCLKELSERLKSLGQRG